MTEPLSTIIDRRDADLAQLGLMEIARRMRAKAHDRQADKIEGVAKALMSDHIHISENGSGRA